MKLLLKHKWHYLNVSIIFVLFLLSVQVRKDKLSLPLSTDFEWVTAHTLITLKVWEEGGGPQEFGFNPVYSFEGKGNEAVGNLGGVMGEDRRLYYTSYPPFSFLFAYYGTKLLGGNNLSNLRTLGLITHLFCAILIYLIIGKLRSRQNDQISIAGITAAFLYLFSAGTLWMHSIMYFADTCVQLFLIAGLYFVIRLLKKDFKNEIIFFGVFGMIIFMGVYTEWVALFFAFFSAVLLLIYFLKRKDRTFLKGFIIITMATITALGLTLAQYSGINGFDELQEVSVAKYAERSGHESGKDLYNWQNPKSFKLMEAFANRNFAMVINISGIALLLLIPVISWQKTRAKIKSLKWKIIILSLTFLSVLTHYLLFFNFNAIHYISNLKTGFLLILLTGIVVLIIEEVLNWKLKLFLSALLLFILIPRTKVELEKFDDFYSYEQFDLNRDLSASLVNQHHNKDKYVFVNMYVTPEYIYKANHNVFQLEDSSRIGQFMRYFDADSAQYFHHEENEPAFLLELIKKNDTVHVIEKTDLRTD